MKIGIISGSSRKGNNTLRVAKAIFNEFQDAEIIDFQDYDIPVFSGEGLKEGDESVFQKGLIRVMDASDLLFILTPEYNWFPSAEVVNMIHTLGNNTYKHLFDNKVIVTVGVSAGRGGRMPAVQLGYVLNKVISFFNLNSVVSPKNFEAQEIFSTTDANGVLLENEVYNKGFLSFLDYSLKLAQRWQVST